MADLSLREKQSLFVKLLAQLIDNVYGRGWELTFGRDFDQNGKSVHMVNSLHELSLAKDLNLFIDGVFIADGNTIEWQQIGEYWEGLNPLCRWGGRFVPMDSNHFSLRHGGRS